MRLQTCQQPVGLGGRYNLALGAVATVQGIGASLSGLAAGIIVDHFGYGTAFLTAAGVAAIALVLLLLAMPETVPAHDKRTRSLSSDTAVGYSPWPTYSAGSWP